MDLFLLHYWPDNYHFLLYMNNHLRSNLLDIYIVYHNHIYRDQILEMHWIDQIKYWIMISYPNKRDHFFLDMKNHRIRNNHHRYVDPATWRVKHWISLIIFSFNSHLDRCCFTFASSTNALSSSGANIRWSRSRKYSQKLFFVSCFILSTLLNFRFNCRWCCITFTFSSIVSFGTCTNTTFICTMIGTARTIDLTWNFRAWTRTICLNSNTHFIIQSMRVNRECGWCPIVDAFSRENFDVEIQLNGKQSEK